jgi:threonine dehydratase
VWDEANRAAMAHVERSGATYVHPFADAAIMAGQGTIALELFRDDPGIDTLIVAIGGGGLIAGIATAAKALNPAMRIVGVEPTGAPTLHASLAAGRIVELSEITTSVPTMAARKTEAINFDIIRRHVAEVVLVSDGEMREAAQFLWFESGLAVDLSGAAAVAALLTGRVRAEAGKRTCALVCGAGADGIV